MIAAFFLGNKKWIYCQFCDISQTLTIIFRYNILYTIYPNCAFWLIEAKEAVANEQHNKYYEHYIDLN